MRGINKVIIVGNLGQDPEVKYLPNGSAIANISVATSETWKDKQTGEQQERTEWHRVVFFGRTAEVVGEYLRKGSQIYVEGSLQTRKWEKDGQTHYTTEVKAREMQMLGSGSAARKESSSQHPNGNSAPRTQSEVPPPFDDELPF